MEKLRYQKRLQDAEEEFKENFTYSDNNTELREVPIEFYFGSQTLKKKDFPTFPILVSSWSWRMLSVRWEREARKYLDFASLLIREPWRGWRMSAVSSERISWTMWSLLLISGKQVLTGWENAQHTREWIFLKLEHCTDTVTYYPFIGCEIISWRRRCLSWLGSTRASANNTRTGRNDWTRWRQSRPGWELRRWTARPGPGWWQTWTCWETSRWRRTVWPARSKLMRTWRKGWAGGGRDSKSLGKIFSSWVYIEKIF